MIEFTATQIRDFVSKCHSDEEALLAKDESWPKISIVTPSFNQGQFLERTILSVLNQDYPNLEYMIMDGGSTDGSVEIIKKYEKYLAYWVSEKDGGQGDAICKGFQRSTGQILAFFNSDDVYLPGTLLRVGRVFRETPKVGVVYGNKYIIDENDRIIGERRLTPFVPHLSKFGMLYGGFGIYQPAAFWTKTLYDRVGGVDASFEFAMDTDLILRLALAGAKFAFLREYFMASRIHRDSKTSTIRHVAKKEGQIIRSRYCKHRSRLLAVPCLALMRTTRATIHLAQGDGFYLLKRKLPTDLAWVP
jgi:glycosyltransferase involved in cell wall biosynthesis